MLFKMFTLLYILLFANLTSLIHGKHLEVLLETESKHGVKQFLDARIVGGVDAPRAYGRHMVALVFGDALTMLMCGGSIITRQHILTAAHCVDPLVIWGQLMPSYRAVIGSSEWTSTEKNIRFTGFVNHPKFDATTLKNDLGVLFLAQEIEIDDNVAIIPLKSDWVGEGAKAFVTGWGRIGNFRPFPEKLQLLHVRTISEEQCSEEIEEISSNGQRLPPYDPAIEICTFHSFGHGMCSGDSGSALVHEDTMEQIGIVSWGFPCAVGAPDVYVRINSYIPWLRNVTSELI